MRLIVAIPERWNDAECPVGWALLDPGGALIREGESPIAGLPKAERVRAIVPAGRVLLTSAKLPARGARRAQHALAYAVEDELTSDPESVHAVPGPALPGGRRSIAVLDKAWMRNLLAALESAGARPHSMTVETCLAPRKPEQWTVVLREDAGFVRTGEASGMALDRGEEGIPPPVLRLALEDARRAGALPQRIAIRSDSVPDPAAWTRELGVPCEAAGPWHAWHAGESAAIELLQREFAPANRMGALWPHLRLAAILAAIAVTLEVTGVVAHWGALRYEKARLEAQMRERFKAAFPQAQAIVDPALQMRRNLEAARGAAGIAQESDFLPLLAEAARHFQGGADRQLKAITYESGKLTLDVTFTDRRLADSMLRSLKESRVSAALDAVNPKGAGAEARFVLAAQGAR